MAFESNLAGITRVAFEAQTGEFNRDVAAAERRYRESTAGMSDAAIKLELAQARLQRQIARGPQNYQALARAELAVRRAEAELASETRRATSTLAQQERTMGRVTRGAIAGSGVFHGLGRSVAFASGAFLGGTGLVYAIRQSIDQAVAQDQILHNLRNSLEAGGHSWARYSQQIETATAALKRQSAFDDEELYQSLQLLVRGTGDVSEALRLNALAADVARGRNMGLVQAATLLVRVHAGQVGSLRRLGIEVDKGISGTKALQQVQRQYAGAAQAYADSAAGAQARFRIAIEDTEKAIGRGLLPQFTRLANNAADWLADADNQARVERDAAHAAHLLGEGLHAVGEAFELAHDAAAPLVRALGGVENAAKILIALKFAGVIRGWASALRLVAPAELAAAGALSRLATSSTGTLGTVAALEGRLLGLRGALLGLGRIGAVAIPVNIALNVADKGARSRFVDDAKRGLLGSAVLDLVFGTDFGLGDIGTDRKGRENAARRRKQAEKEISANAEAVRGAQADAAAAIKRAAQLPDTSYAAQLRAAGFNENNQPQTRRGRPTAQLPRSLADAALRASLTGSLADDLTAARAEEAFLQRQLARARKGTKLYSDILAALVSAHSQVESAQAAIDAEEERHGQALAEQRRKRREAAERRARAYRDELDTREQRLRNQVEAARSPAQRRRREDALLTFLKREVNDARLTGKERERYRAELQKERDEALRDARADRERTLEDAVARAELALDKATKGTAAYEKAIAAERRALRAEISFEERVAKIAKTAQERRAASAKATALQRKLGRLEKQTDTDKADAAGEFRRMAAEFLQSLQGTLNTYGGNLFQPGQLHTQAVVQTSLLRRQNELLEGLGRGLRHPGARYARMELTTVNDGVGVF